MVRFYTESVFCYLWNKFCCWSAKWHDCVWTVWFIRHERILMNKKLQSETQTNIWQVHGKPFTLRLISFFFKTITILTISTINVWKYIYCTYLLKVSNAKNNHQQFDGILLIFNVTWADHFSDQTRFLTSCV